MTAKVETSRRAASPPRAKEVYELREKVEVDLLTPLMALQRNATRREVQRDANGRAQSVLEEPAWPWPEYQRRATVAVTKYLAVRKILLPDEQRLGDELVGTVMEAAGLVWRQTSQAVIQPGPSVLAPA